MTRFVVVVVLLTAVTALGTQVSTPSPSSPPVTFNKDVLPILQRDCQVCHRPGGAAPMSLLTYESARPWAKAIKEKVLKREMPPWFADPRYGGFRNAPKLTETDMKTLAAWAESGAKEGDAKDKPSPVQWVDGWRTKPDVIIAMEEPYRLPAKGGGEIKSFFVKNPFSEDTWVTAIEVRPGNPSVVHHVIVQVGEDELTRRRFSWGSAPPQFTTAGAFATMEAVYVPGSQPIDFRFHNSAKLIPGRKQVRIEVHYTPNGTATTDQTMVGFTLAKEPAKRQFVTMAPTSMVDTRNTRIPAGESDWESRGELTFNQDAELVWFMPHMHLRGKDMTFTLLYPNGRTDTVLSAKFNFAWQLGYEVEDPIRVRKGTKMIVTAHHDNSANNPFNPAPNEEVQWGDLTSQEMMLPWFGVVVDTGAKPENIASYRSGVPPPEGFLPRLPRVPATPGIGGATPPFNPGRR